MALFGKRDQPPKLTLGDETEQTFDEANALLEDIGIAGVPKRPGFGMLGLLVGSRVWTPAWLLLCWGPTPR